MEITLTTWLLIPAVGGIIGYATNRLAVKMIFRPVKPINILGFKLQGLMPRRQLDMAKSIGAVVGDHLVNHKDIAEGLSKLDLEALLRDLLETGLAEKVQDLRSMPLIGGFLTDDRINDIRDSIVRSLLARKEEIFQKIETALEQGLDVQAVVTEKVASFPVPKLEELVLQVAAKELRAIEVLGGILGVIIGLGQVGLLLATG